MEDPFAILANVDIEAEECGEGCGEECEHGPAMVTPLSGFDLFLVHHYASERSEEEGT